MYVVIRAFFDKTDNNRLYRVGDSYPADGVKAAKSRTEALLSGKNANGKVYIRQEPDAEKKEPDTEK